MSNMHIVIPTRGRKNDQLTIQNLSKELLKRTTVVCPQREVSYIQSLRDDIEVIAQPDVNWKIAQKREWIIQEWIRRGYDKIIMLDDDLRFATRISDDDWHLKEARGEELVKEFQRIEDKLGPEFPHVGFGQRQGNSFLTEVGWKTPGKMVCTLGYYLPIVSKECRWDLVELREDMCITMQLLLKGYPNAILTETVVDQREFDAPGGCSTYRDVLMSNFEAERFQKLYPDFISISERKYKSKRDKATSTRLEVNVKWQRALEEGQRRRACSS